MKDNLRENLSKKSATEFVNSCVEKTGQVRPLTEWEKVAAKRKAALSDLKSVIPQATSRRKAAEIIVEWLGVKKEKKELYEKVFFTILNYPGRTWKEITQKLYDDFNLKITSAQHSYISKLVKEKTSFTFSNFIFEVVYYYYEVCECKKKSNYNMKVEANSTESIEDIYTYFDNKIPIALIDFQENNPEIKALITRMIKGENVCLPDFIQHIIEVMNVDEELFKGEIDAIATLLTNSVQMKGKETPEESIVNWNPYLKNIFSDLIKSYFSETDEEITIENLIEWLRLAKF